MKGLLSFYNNNLQYFFEENIHRKNNQLLIRVGHNDKLIMKTEFKTLGRLVLCLFAVVYLWNNEGTDVIKIHLFSWIIITYFYHSFLWNSFFFFNDDCLFVFCL